MKEAIRYESIETKNALESQMAKPLSAEESLVHCLNAMDFIAAFRKDPVVDSSNIEGFILEKKRK